MILFLVSVQIFSDKNKIRIEKNKKNKKTNLNDKIKVNNDAKNEIFDLTLNEKKKVEYISIDDSDSVEDLSDSLSQENRSKYNDEISEIQNELSIEYDINSNSNTSSINSNFTSNNLNENVELSEQYTTYDLHPSLRNTFCSIDEGTYFNLLNYFYTYLR